MRREAAQAPVAVFYRGRRQRHEAPAGAGRPWANFRQRPLAKSLPRHRPWTVLRLFQIIRRNDQQGTNHDQIFSTATSVRPRSSGNRTVRLAAPRRPLAALSAKPRQLIRYRFGLPPCQGPPGRGSLIESLISHTLSAGHDRRRARRAPPPVTRIRQVRVEVLTRRPQKVQPRPIGTGWLLNAVAPASEAPFDRTAMRASARPKHWYPKKPDRHNYRPHNN